MFNLKIFDKHKGEYLYWRKVKTGGSAIYTFINESGTNRIGYSALEYPKRYKLCIGIFHTDKKGVELFTHDLVKRDDGLIGEIRYHRKAARFFVKYNGKVDKVESELIEKIGDIFHNADMVKWGEKVNA